MGSPLTIGSDVECGHKGLVTVQSSAKLTIAGQAVLVASGVMGGPIAACTTAPSPSTKPCTAVVAVLPVSQAIKLTAGGAGVVLDSLLGLTDGLPPGTLFAAAGQSKLTAV